MARFQKALAQLMRQEDGEQAPGRTRSAAAGSVVSELQTRVSSEELGLVSAFTGLFLPNARLMESALSTNDIAGLTLGACRFLCDRLSLPLSTRVYLPTSSEHGWSSPNVVLEVATDDQPGLVNTVCGVVEQQGVQIEALVSATAAVRRDPTGLALGIAPGEGVADESLIHVQLSGVDNPAGLEDAVRQHLEALGRTRQDAGPLLSELSQLSAQLSSGAAEDREAAELLSWLEDGRFNLAGIQEIGPDGAAARSLGIYLDPPTGLEQAWDGSPADGGVVMLKTKAHDPVNLGAYLDEIRLRPAHPTSSDPRAYRIVGTLSAQAFRERAGGAPVARTVCADTLGALRNANEATDVDSASSVFDRLPIDFVLAVDAAEIAGVIDVILTSHAQPGFRVRVSPPRNAAGTTSFLTVVAPRQHLARSDADRVAQIVRERGGPILARRFVSDDLSVARLHYTIDVTAGKLRPEVVEDLTAQIRKVLSSWKDAPVVERSPAAPESQPAPRATPPEPPTETDRRERIELRPDQTSSRRFTLRITTGREPGTFNQLVSAIDNLGLRILRHQSETPSPAAETHDIAVELGGEGNVDAGNLVQLVEAMRDGSVESDELSSLSWRAGMNAASIDLLRAFGALAELMGTGHRRVVHDAMVRNVDATQAFMRAFETKFDPRLPLANENQRNRELATALAVLQTNAAQSENHGDRRVLRELGRILDCTVRTSFFCGDKYQPGRTIALKLENPELAVAPYETFVYAPGFEGDLLRGGQAARVKLGLVDDLASLRWSCLVELEDQSIRARHVCTDPGVAYLAIKSRVRRTDQTDRALRSFVKAILDVTDNIANGELARDASVVAYDEADSYCSFLTSERPTGFADIARRVVTERGFWMGDAAVTSFDSRVASEGAWAGLQGLLNGDRDREDPITVVAVGSPHELRLPPSVRLVAAFDEHEIFLDPLSDAKKSSEALAKLGRQETSSWSDFPIDLRERGSTVLSRSARKIELSQEARDLLGWTDNSADADGVLEAILAHNADLLWICAPTVRAVTAAELNRHLSGRLEVDGTDVGARFVAEIGHALFSPAARVAFALSGGIVHTPAHDGVTADLVADRVSNVDLALDLAGSLREGVEAYSAEVAAGIRRAALEVPSRERLAIELDQQRSSQDWNAAAVCIRRLRESGRSEALDHYSISDVDLARSRGASIGLTRPEVSVLRSAVGVELQREVRGSSLCEDPYIRPWLDNYFPAPIAEQSPQLVDQHPLRYEIAALAVSERILEVMGFAFVADTAETHGRPQLDIVKAWCAAMIFGGAQEVWSEIESSEIAAGSPDYRRHRLSITRALQGATQRIVELRSADLSLERIMDRLAAGVGEILRAWPETLPDTMKPAHEEAIDLGVRTGLGRVVADHLARIAHLADIVDICDLAIQINSPRSTVAAVFLGLGPLLGFNEIDRMVLVIRHQDPHWGERAAVHLQARLAAAHRGLATEVVSNAAGRRQPIERYIDAHQEEILAVQRTIGEVKSGGQASIAAVEVMIGSLENLTRGQRRSW